MSTFTAHWHLQPIGHRLEVVWFAQTNLYGTSVTSKSSILEAWGYEQCTNVEAYKDIKASKKEFY
jgi:hypothetical protein